MSDHNVQRGGWATAQEPCLVSNTLRNAPRVNPSIKHREAEQLRAAVEAHIRTGGSYENLDAPTGDAA